MQHDFTTTRSLLTFLAAVALASGTVTLAAPFDDGPGVKPAAKAETPGAATGIKAAPPADASEPLLQPILPSWLGFSLLARGRIEDQSGIGFAPGVSDTFYSSRLRFDLAVRPSPWLRFFAQAQDSRSFGYSASPAPGSVYDPWDLHQAYVEVGSPEGKLFQARFGRQEMSLGSGRLIGAPDFSNTGKSFDAARMTLSHGFLKADLFAGSLVQLDSSRFDRHKPGDHIYGSYVNLKTPLRGMVVEPFLVARTQLAVLDERGIKGNSHLYTGGGRVFGKLTGRIDYQAEVMTQWGYVATDQVQALAQSYNVGWIFLPSRWKPRLSFDVNAASGDGSNKDGYRNTFDQLYPSVHSAYGIADQSGERNIRQYKLGVDAAPSRRLKASVDFRELYLATVQDGFYNSSGTRTVLNRNATSDHVGSELDVQAIYLLPRGLNLGVGLAHIFPGEYLKQSTKGGAYTYPYLMWTRRF